MHMTNEMAVRHLRYSAWASRKLVEAAGKLTGEEQFRDQGNSDRSVVETLAHVYAADRVWYGRVTGNPVVKFLDPEVDYKLETLEREWGALMGKWAEYAGCAEMEGVCEYADLRGNQHRTPLWQIIAHVVNHGTHHRGMVAAMLRRMGHVPPAVDLIFYYREMGQ